MSRDEFVAEPMPEKLGGVDTPTPQSRRESFVATCSVSVCLFPIPFGVGALFSAGPLVALSVLIISGMQGLVLMLFWHATLGAGLLWMRRRWTLSPSSFIALSSIVGIFAGTAVYLAILATAIGHVHGAEMIVVLCGYVGLVGGISLHLSRNFKFDIGWPLEKAK